MSSVALRLTAFVLVGVLALPPGLASADDPADLRGSIAALRQSLAQLREPPNLMLERDLSPLERLQRWVGVGLRKEHVGQYSDLWLHARNHQSFAALEAAIAENLLDVGAVESARKHLGYASANLRVRHLYDEAASEVWRGNLEHAQAALLEAGKVVTSSLGLLGKVLESSKVKVVSEAGLALQGESLVLELGLDYAFHGMPTALANLFYAAGEQKVVEWAANYAKVDPREAELARRGIRTAYHAGQFIAHLAANVGPSAELQALIEEELRKLPAEAQESVDQALRELARLRGRPATEAVARPRPTPKVAPTATPTQSATSTPRPTPNPQPTAASLTWPITAPGREGQSRSCTNCRVPVATVPVGEMPHSVAVNPVTNRIYVGGLGSNSITVIDGSTKSVLTTIQLPSPPRADRQTVVVNTIANRIYVASMVTGTIDSKANPNRFYVIDGSSNAIMLNTSDFANFPAGVVFNPTTGRIYISDLATIGISVVDSVTLKALDGIRLSTKGPSTLALNSATNRLYAAQASSVSVVDLRTNTQISTIPVAGDIWGLTVGQATNRVYAAIRSKDLVAVIDASRNTVLGSLSLSASDGTPILRGPVDVAVNPRTGRVYVPGADSPYVIVFDAENRFWGLRLMDDWPKAVALNTDTGLAYLPAWSTNRVVVLDEN